MINLHFNEQNWVLVWVCVFIVILGGLGFGLGLNNLLVSSD